jgi:3',5'-cyclic-AMP phosphodiesterase
VTGSFTRAINQVNGLGFRPDFVVHTGDLTHLSTQAQFDQVSSDTPIVLFSHIPLFAMYPPWGWGTDDATQALSYLRNVTFYSATTTAYPLPHPGQGPAPIPVTLPAGQLGAALGIRDVTYQPGQHALAVRDRRLS